MKIFSIVMITLISLLVSNCAYRYQQSAKKEVGIKGPVKAQFKTPTRNDFETDEDWKNWKKHKNENGFVTECKSINGKDQCRGYYIGSLH